MNTAWVWLGACALAVIASQLLAFVLHGAAYGAATALCGYVCAQWAIYRTRYV